MMSRMAPTALITGASAGIGEAFARVLAGRGFDLILTARRLDRLEKLAAELAASRGIRVEAIAADLARPDAPAFLQSEVERRGLRVDWLVNNAGYGLPGVFTALAWAAHEDFLRVMLTAPTELCHRFLPGMIERGYGRIINVSSVAGLSPSPAGSTLYGPTKSCLVRFSQSLAQEVRPHGVLVSALCPGFTWSEFHDVSGTRAEVSRYPRLLWMDAETVARRGIRAVERGRIIFVPGAVNRVLWFFARHMPEGLAVRIMSRSSRHRLGPRKD
jgi:short-subunit dehydrogenase